MHWKNLSNLLQIPVCMMILGLLALESRALAAPRSGELEITVVDADTNEPMACRMHLKNARGRPRKAPKLPFLKDHFCFDGTLSMTLREGNYTFELECGPEYYTRTGHFSMDRAGSDTKNCFYETHRRHVRRGLVGGGPPRSSPSRRTLSY